MHLQLAQGNGAGIRATFSARHFSGKGGNNMMGLKLSLATFKRVEISISDWDQVVHLT